MKHTAEGAAIWLQLPLMTMPLMQQSDFFHGAVKIFMAPFSFTLFAPQPALAGHHHYSCMRSTLLASVVAMTGRSSYDP
ncbi:MULTISPECIES: hypothetical protein [Serratia]|uniref:hypothetical protein n=1 Tax=Serratia TaxID=613 RepID=UPI0013EA3268|nr:MULTISPECIES: hypothetical protein [Serratia]